MSKISRKIVYGDEWEALRDKGVEQAYMLAKNSYGPSAGNVAIETNYGYPVVSRDGVTNLRKLYLEEGNENMAGRIVVQASEKSNKVVGDGTTAVVILTYHLYREAVKRIAAGHNRMVVKREIETLAGEIIKDIEKFKIEATPEMLRAVAKVSASDQAIGDMVADVIDRVGVEGNIIVEEFDGVGSYDEEVTGFYFRKGFSNEFLINNMSLLESRLNDVDIFITEKPMRTAADIGAILSKIIEAGGRGVEVLIVGDVAEEAFNVLALNKAKENIFPTLVDVPVYGPMRSLFLEDLATYTGGTVFHNGEKATSFTTSMLGSASKVIVNSFSTTIIGGDSAEEDVQKRVQDLRDQLKETDNLVDQEEIKKRLAILTGKISIIRVGAPTDVDKGEVKLRVEDAIAATQSAMSNGIVPGGGVCLARVAKGDFKDAFTAPFETLCENAGLNPKESLFRMLSAKDKWSGFDLRDPSSIPVNLLECGVIDPAEVVTAAVRNASSVVGTLITTTVGITFVDREMKSD